MITKSFTLLTRITRVFQLYEGWLKSLVYTVGSLEIRSCSLGIGLKETSEEKRRNMGLGHTHFEVPDIYLFTFFWGSFATNVGGDNMPIRLRTGIFEYTLTYLPQIVSNEMWNIWLPHFVSKWYWKREFKLVENPKYQFWFNI